MDKGLKLNELLTFAELNIYNSDSLQGEDITYFEDELRKLIATNDSKPAQAGKLIDLEELGRQIIFAEDCFENSNYYMVAETLLNYIISLRDL